MIKRTARFGDSGLQDGHRYRMKLGRKRRRSRAPWIGLVIVGTVAIVCAVLVAAISLARREPIALPRDFLQPNQERLIGRWQTAVHFGRPGTALLEFQRDGLRG